MSNDRLPVLPENSATPVVLGNAFRKRHRKVHNAALPAEEPIAVVPAEEPAAAPEPAHETPPVRAQSPILGALNSLGGAAGILPLVLVVGALQRGKGPAVNTAAAPPMPAPPPELPVEESKIEAKTQTAVRRRIARKELAPDPAPAAAPEPPEPAPAEQPEPRPQRRMTPPMDVRNLLSDISGYLPASGSAATARAARIMGLADEIKNLGHSDVSTVSYAPSNPLDRQAGLLGVLSRNLPISGASNLGQISQVISMVNTLRKTSSPSGGGLNNMAGMLGSMMGNQGRPAAAPASAPDLKSSGQADGLKDTVNRLLSGMDDKQKDQLMNRAKDLLGRK